MCKLEVVQKFSIARAVGTDGGVIAEIAHEETRDERDRRLVLQMSGRSPDHDAPPP
jgi:hypothetical protein